MTTTAPFINPCHTIMSDNFATFTDPISVILSNAIYGDVVVLDIDATVLFQSIQHNNTSGIDPNPHGIEVYMLCIQYNIPVFFVTARVQTQNNIEKTVEHLKSMGLDKYTGLYMRPADITGWAQISQFKANVRRQIAQQATILLNVGDMWSDVHETHDDTILSTLQQQSGNLHVLFMTNLPETAIWALKLAESRP